MMSLAVSARVSRGSNSPAALARVRTLLTGAVVLLLSLALVQLQPALAAPRFAAIAVDAHTGKVLFSRSADEICHPASLTKIMTLYVLFQEMASGRVTRDTRFTVSKTAASREPSKLYLKPGETIRADDAVRALVTKSANDAAVTIAEGISGTEAAFAERMTRTARSMGMTRTTFRNANGLPDPKQVTTARDMATLGLRIQRDFPQYYSYFSLRSFKYKGASYHNHNRLMSTFAGMDGIKTGFIRASGFNLVASAERDGKRLVGVVMGGKSAASRNQYMASMMETQFDKATFQRGGRIAAAAGDPPGYVRGQQTEDPTRRTAQRGSNADDLASTRQEIARVQSAIEEAEARTARQPSTRTARADPKDAGRLAAEKLRAARLAAQKQLAMKYAAEMASPSEPGDLIAAATDQASGQIAAKMAEASLAPPKADGVQGQTFASVTVSEDVANPIDPTEKGVQAIGKSDNLAALDVPVVAPAPSEGFWTIQIGAFPTRDGAERRIEEARSLGLNGLSGKAAFTMSVQIGDEILYRARFSGFTERAARDACKTLATRGVSCFPLAPQG